MESFKTIKEAREHAKIKNVATHIIEIEPGKEGINPFICAKGSAETLQKMLNRKPMVEIKRVVGNAVDLAKEEYEEKENKKHKNIPGLVELEKIIMDWDYYQEGCSRMMEDEMNDGVNPPKRPSIEVAEIAKRYPIAAAYIKADNWSMASHYVKSAAGDKAKIAIENGEDYKIVIAEMEKIWNDHTTNHMWD